MPTASVIIPTLGRKECLDECLESLSAQTRSDFEIILVREEGPLAKLRNDGARRAKGDYLIFIDDDVVTSPGWFSAIMQVFESRMDIGGVSGPATITDKFKRNRDIFRFPLVKLAYDFLFLDGAAHLPGHITQAGAWTTGAVNPDCRYEGYVQFLEACNSAYRRSAFEKAHGFDETYKGVGDWSEPDLSFRVRRAGYKLWFSRDARLEHRPSRSGAYKKRHKDSRNRMANYEVFASRWVLPHWKHELYKQFMRAYYTWR